MSIKYLTKQLSFGRELIFDLDNTIFDTPFDALPGCLQEAFGSERTWKTLISTDFQHETTSIFFFQFLQYRYENV